MITTDMMIELFETSNGNKPVVSQEESIVGVGIQRTRN
jgi:hypothetical protein